MTDIRTENTPISAPTNHLSTMNELNKPSADDASGIFRTLFNVIPSPYNSILAVMLLSLGAYLAYNYYMPKKEKEDEKVFVSGKIIIDGHEPKPNVVKNLYIKNMPDVKSSGLDVTGKFDFKNVTVPPEKRLCIMVTFKDGTVLPTETSPLGEPRKDDHTIYIDDLPISSPQPAKAGRTAQPWLFINQTTIIGDNNNVKQ
jgi:hypothetical protein